MVSTPMYLGLYEDYCTTNGSCDFMVFGKLNLCGVNSCISKFVWRLLYRVGVMWLYGDLKLTILRCYGHLKSENGVFNTLTPFLLHLLSTNWRI